MLKVLNYGALILEPLFPLIFILPKGHPAKYGLLLALFGFHVGTLATLQIPFANIACLAAMIIPFGGELMDRLRGGASWSQPRRAPARVGRCDAFALLFVAVLTLAMLSSVSLPQWRAPTRRGYAEAAGILTVASGGAAVESRVACCATGDQDTGGAEGLGPLQKVFFSSLWCIGIAQQYQLFNWIDERNYTVRYRITEYGATRAGARSSQARCLWINTRRPCSSSICTASPGCVSSPVTKQSFAGASRHEPPAATARGFSQGCGWSFYSTVERVVPGGNRVEGGPVLLMRFSCDGGEPEMQAMNLDP